MIGLNEVLAIHDILIERFGGSKGVRDRAGLEAAINRPIKHLTGKLFILIQLTKPRQSLKV